MSDIDEPRDVRLHFEGTTRMHQAIPAKVLVNSLDHLQRIIHLLAKLHRGDNLGRRVRVSRALEEHFTLMCKVPQEGSYVVPTEIGNCPPKPQFGYDPVAHVQRTFHDVTLAMDQGDLSKLCKVVPNADYRTQLVKEYKAIQPSRKTGLVCSIEDGAGRKVLNGYTASSAIAELDAPPPYARVERTYIAGTLIRMDFERRRLRIELVAGPLLNASYSDYFEPTLLSHPRGLIQVRAEVTYDDQEVPIALSNVDEILQVNEDSISMHEKMIDNVPYRIQPPLDFAVRFDPSSCLYDLEGDLGVCSFAETRSELEDALHAEIEMLWVEYAREEPQHLSPKAQKLRNELRARFREAHDGA